MGRATRAADTAPAYRPPRACAGCSWKPSDHANLAPRLRREKTGPFAGAACILHIATTSPGPAPMNKPFNIEKEALQFPTIDAGVRMAHVHLKVPHLQR